VKSRLKKEICRFTTMIISMVNTEDWLIKTVT
jgi:hypothetical protein